MDQLELDLQTRARDRALDLLEQHRGNLVVAAYAVAVELAQKLGRVTSTQVTTTLRERGFGDQLDAVDRRFLGAVFRENRGWVRIGWENTGSHRRPVAIWRLNSEKAG